MKQPFDQLFAAIRSLSPRIRYVALYRDGVLESREADGIRNASSSESDKYEERIVNPTLLTLVRQRGDIDCGGATHLVIGYGNFTQLVVAIPGGHASVAFELGSNPLDYVPRIRALFEEERAAA
jgi:hypothetical protein